MSGPDETFLPPEEGGEKLPPHPATPAPPNFGQSSAGTPAVVFQTSDTQPGMPAFSGSPPASDAEETMTPPLPKRSGPSAPDGRPTTPPQDSDTSGAAPHDSASSGSAPQGAASAGPGAHVPNGTTPHGSVAPGPVNGFPPPPGSQADGASVPEAERTAADPGQAQRPWWMRDAPANGTPDPATGRAAADGTPPCGPPANGSPTPYGPAPAGPGFGGPPFATPGSGRSPHNVPASGPAGDPSSGVSDANAERTGNGDATSPTSVPSPGAPASETDEQKVTFEDANGRRTLAIARFGAGTSSGTPGPALDPDAILPPGTPLHSPPDPPPDPNATSTGPIPRLTAGPGFPGGARPPRGDGGASGARRALLVAGGLVAALVLGGGGALAVTSLSGVSKDDKAAQPHPPAPPPTHAQPTPTPSKTKPKRKPKPVPVDIRDEKKDPRPLTIGEVFPSAQIKLAGITFNRVKTVINDHCSLAANGPFAAELTRQYCRRVVRATFVSTDKKIAVTTGIAVMPTDAAAKAALKTQDPAHYEWFRGMKAPGAPKIDQAGGFAASTLRGRYISYAYATYADGHKPAAKDDTLKKVGTAFRDSTARPIERRARQH
jgi:hypothetical protein